MQDDKPITRYKKKLGICWEWLYIEQKPINMF